MDYREITKMYYEMWIGRAEALTGSGVEAVYSEERNTVQPGYGSRFDLYALITDDRITVSFGDALAEKSEEIRGALRSGMAAEQAACALERLLGCRTECSVKYVYAGTGKKPACARPLRKEEYRLYRDFFVQGHPGCKDTEWLEEYFLEMAQDGLCCAYLLDGRAVSCTDAPTMPYMADAVQEIGVNTLPEFRRRGFAADGCLAAAQQILERGKCPMWSTGADNPASQRLAESVGFERFADCLTISLPE